MNPPRIERKRAKKSKTAQDVQSAECLSQTPGPNPHDASINSTNVSSLLSPAVGAGGAVTVERKLEQCDTNAIKPGMTSVDDIKGPLTSYCAKDMVVAPVPPARSNKKKKKKVASEMNAATRSDSETPITGLKSDVIAELKEKVKKKKRKSDHVCTDNDVTPVSNEMSTTETMKHGDDVFATPTKNQTPVAKPSLGQWGKVELGSTEKTQKFFRLLGGMKKQTGSPLSFRSSKGSASSADGREDPEKAIMAMGRKDADVLNNKLEEQFKKALGGIGKGKVGLGFSPQLDPSTKNFHIDVNSSKSVKF